MFAYKDSIMKKFITLIIITIFSFYIVACTQETTPVEYKVKCIKAVLGDKDLAEGCNTELKRLNGKDDRVIFLTGIRGLGLVSFTGTEFQTNNHDYEYKLTVDMAGGMFRSIGKVGDKAIGECIVWKPKHGVKKITCLAQTNDIVFDFEWQIINEWPMKK